MSAATAVRSGWVVRNRAGQVVVIFQGADAEQAAHDWEPQGYRVEVVELG
jgi:hypothetical protein